MLQQDFYLRDDTLSMARDLLGMELVTRFEGQETVGRIVETEAYLGIEDKACHGYGGLLTPRTQTMYLAGGHAYVYLCYGIHNMFNVVVREAGVPHVVLVRAIEPLHGVEIMEARRKKASRFTLGSGPGNVCAAMGITRAHNGLSLCSASIHIREGQQLVPDAAVVRSPRIGVDYAGEDALLPYRFHERGNPCVSRAKG